MKSAHRFILILFVLILTVSTVTSCDFIENLIKQPVDPELSQKPFHTHSFVEGKCECGKVDPDYKPEHIHSFVEGKCECGETDPDYKPVHTHSFVEGKCECGETDPDYVPPHKCESICDDCGACLDPECDEEVCQIKCEGHNSGYDYFPIITEEMPAIHINTSDKDNSWATKYTRADKLAGNIEYVSATVSVAQCDEEFILTDVEASVKVRGNYTLEYEKKPIRIKFSEKHNMLGLHKGEEYKNWVLLADWKDLSMTNNTVAFYLGNTILGSDGYYCTDFRNVEVYLNGEYWGVYLLVEQQEAKDGRSSVPEVEKNYTGTDIGYFFEYDGYYTDERNIPDGDPTIVINHQGLPAGSAGYTVKSDINDPAQLKFLEDYVNNVMYIAHQATKGNYYHFDENYNPVFVNGYTDAKTVIGLVIDLQSLVDTYILNEIAKDLDVDWSSFYLSLNMTAEGNKKITFEAPWDFDSSFGIISRENCSATEGLYAATNANPWFQLVVNQDWFWEMVREKWAEMKENGVLTGAMELINAQKTVYKDYYIKNYNRWQRRVTGGNGECVSQLNKYTNINTAQGLAADYLIGWLDARLTWLDSQWKIQEKIPENAKAYVYEAEKAELVGFVADAIRVDKDYASEKSYVGRVELGTSLHFTVNAEEAATVYVFVGLSKRSSNRTVSNLFSLTVNGESAETISNVLPAISAGEEEWHTFVSIRFATVDLKEGENTLVFTTISSDATNFDYIEIYSETELN